MKNVFNLNFYTIALLAAMLFTTNGYSQQQQTSDESDLTPKFGFKGGVNLSNLYVDDVKDENMKAGLNAGVYAKLPVALGFSIQPELIYSSKGAKLTYDNFIQGSGEYRFNLNYVEIPVLAVFNITKNININAGGYAAYLASANVKKVNDSGTITDAEDLKADNFNRFDYGLIGGVGVDIENFTFGARYNYGLKEIGKSGSLSGDLTKNSKNSAISLYIGVAF